ncbi:hemicentin-2 [Caerostris extrusa]|uniref:Hemicentin-2 n=1 Tax=Caerostris extrusa TaxID=172846 RepID=A0AAV4T092_CAEEX|nr:hemicentin-2 [Caerostris extrusa]
MKLINLSRSHPRSQRHVVARQQTLDSTFQNRSDLFAPFHCKAQNTKLTSSVVRTIVLDMYLYPLTSRITSRLSTLAAGRRLDLACETQGSRPSAKISWWLEGSRLSDHTDTVHDNITFSVLRLPQAPAQQGDPLLQGAQPQALRVPWKMSGCSM